MPDADSDDDMCRAESSDDDIDAALQGNLNCQESLVKRTSHNKLDKLSCSKQVVEFNDDEFDKEMSKELVDTVKALEVQCIPPVSCVDITNSTSSGEKPTCYDNAYFDSDSDEEGTSQDKIGAKHPVVSNDDLLYDPDADADDQKWVDKQRHRYQPKQNSKSEKKQKLPSSDAILDCPACMVTVCLDCQRHDTYKNQYRAMFVQHCRVDKSETLNFPTNAKKRKRKQAVSGTSDPIYNPVYCDVCSTHIAMYDTDEVYHFFNILASYS